MSCCQFHCPLSASFAATWGRLSCCIGLYPSQTYIDCRAGECRPRCTLRAPFLPRNSLRFGWGQPPVWSGWLNAPARGNHLLVQRAKPVYLVAVLRPPNQLYESVLCYMPAPCGVVLGWGGSKWEGAFPCCVSGFCILSARNECCWYHSRPLIPSSAIARLVGRFRSSVVRCEMNVCCSSPSVR